MHSIRTKITVLTVSAIIIALSIATLISGLSINNLGRSDADQLLHLMCKTGAMNLDSYFEGVENSVETVSTLVQNSFEGMPYEDLDEQVERARTLFGEVAYNTNGVLTYYFRIDPEVSKTVKGFWYVNLDGKGFKEHEVTDITKYNTNDTSALVWFTVPKATGQGVWLPPYITDNLDVRVISYNIPVYWEDKFLGVIGIEIDYETLAHEIENIRVYDNGYAFILDDESNIIYHPYEKTEAESKENFAVNNPFQKVGDNHVKYRYKGVEKEAVWMPLSNYMRLYVTVPVSEINSGWQKLLKEILLASLAVLLIAAFITMRFTGRLTKPLSDLTEAAKQVDNGNYEFDLEYNEDDEIGILTRTFKVLVDHVKNHINDLSKRVYVDALTSVRNKGAYGDYIQKLQDQIDEGTVPVEFAIGVFDCDNLKLINDTYGHDKGDAYLKTASQLICRIYKHSPVFRIGGDEFAVILQNDDYRNRDDLIIQFRESRDKLCEAAENEWEQVNVTMGLAVYDPDAEDMVIDVARSADQQMYENKRVRKKKDKKLEKNNHD